MQAPEVAKNLEQIAPKVVAVAILLVPVTPTIKVKNHQKVAEADTFVRSLRAKSEFA